MCKKRMFWKQTDLLKIMAEQILQVFFVVY